MGKVDADGFSDSVAGQVGEVDAWPATEFDYSRAGQLAEPFDPGADIALLAPLKSPWPGRW